MADPAACQGKAGVVLYILQVSRYQRNTTAFTLVQPVFGGLFNSLFDLDLLTAVEHFVVEFVRRAHFVVFECFLCVTVSH